MSKGITIFSSSIVSVVVITLLSQIPSVYADVIICENGNHVDTVEGDILVPHHKNCDLNGATILGNVHIEGSATIIDSYILGNVEIDESVAIIDSTILGNVQSDGANLISISKSYINGNVDVADSSSVEINNQSTIDGNVIADGIRNLRIISSEIIGNVVIQGGNGSVLILNNSMGDIVNGIAGNILIKERTEGMILISDNTISDGNIHILQNTLQSSSISIHDNIVSNGNVEVKENHANHEIFANLISGNLQCSDNNLGFEFVGDENTASQKEGQCSEF